MLDEELRCMRIVEGMAQRGDPLDLDHLNAVLRYPVPQAQFLRDERVDPAIREEFATLVREAQGDVEACNTLWRMKWYVMQCRWNPALKERATRLWCFTALL